MKACLQLQQLFCSRENQLALIINQQNEKYTSNYTRREWDRGTALVQGVEKASAKGLWLKNRILTLRCIHKDLVPVSIKLKTTLRTEKAKKMIRIAEKILVQARINSINSILDNNTKQRELCRSKLASILSTSNFRKCQVFVEKVGEFRFNKVKSRQVNRFNNLVCKKEGNITWETSQSNRVIASSLQAGRQAGSHPPSPGWHCFPGSQHGHP